MKNKILLLIVGIFMLLAVSAVSAGTVTRDFSDSSVEVGDEITVTLTIDVDGKTYYAIDELIASEFEIVDKGEGDISDSGHIKFVIIQDAEDVTYTYKIKATATGDYDFSGDYMFEGDNEENSVLGENKVSVSEKDDEDDDRSSGGGGCTTNWKCSDWSPCIDEKQTRTCSKEKAYCYAGKKPLEERDCSIGTEGEEDETIGTKDEDKGTISKITGAVTGTLGTAGTIIAIVAIIVLITLTIAIRARKKRL